MIAIPLVGFLLLTASRSLSASPSPNVQAAQSPPSSLKISSCRIGQTRAAGLCGTLTVYEDRAAKAGRTIGIHFVVIEAKHRTHRALAFNPGGPGASATDSAADIADVTNGAFATLRDRYDILLVDNRGTGQSAPQDCNFAPPAHPELYFRQVWPDTIVAACRNRLAEHANLSLYSTSAASDDLDDVRAALAYPKLLLFGGSYGTRFYLDYARRHPDNVESIVLEGVAPPHFYVIPLPMAKGAQTGLDNLERACRKDTTCATHFPHFAEHFAALLRRFDSGALTLSVRNSVTHRAQTVQLTKEVFGETIRHELYFPGGAAYIPVTIERAYSGNYRPLGEMTDQMAQTFANILAGGLNLSVSCAEDVPFITQADTVRSSIGTFEGDARVRAQQRACKLWSVDAVPTSFQDPVSSKAAILMVSGTDDPATPPEYARASLAYLPNARIMLIEGASHDSDYPPCVDARVVAFVRSGSAAGLDLQSCAAKYQRPSFATLAYDEPGAGENPAQTIRFSAFLRSIINGQMDRSQLTTALAKQYPDAAVRGLAADIRGLGDLQAIVFKGRTGPPKARVYEYLMRFAQGNLFATFTLNAADRIAGLDIS